MEPNIFWEVFRDTGDPLCWLLSRMQDPKPQERAKEDGEEPPSPPPA